MNGSYSGNDLFFEVAAAGGTLTVGGNGPAPLTAGTRISLVADTLVANSSGLIGNPGGTLELATFSPSNLSLAGVSGSLSGVNVGNGTLVIGGYTNLPVGSSAVVTTAASIAVAGPVNLTGRAGTLEFLANGSVTEPGGPLTVGTITGAALGDFSLSNPGNQIQASSGITATGGNVVLVDGESLTLSGSYSGNDLFFEVAAAGGNLTVGGGGPASLSAAAGASISLVADGLTANTAGSIGNAGGTVELAPFSAINVSLAGTGATGGMLISTGVLSDISVGGGTLVIGGYTNLPAGGSAFVPTAGAISLDGAVDLSGRAGTLVLLANGAVTEPGGPLTVGTVTGVSAGDFSLSNPANQIQASTGITATGGDVIVADDPTMTLTGTYTGNNLFFEVTMPGGSLALGDATEPATLIASTGGRVSLVADDITATAASTITAPYGTLEVAPYSAINESVLGTNATGQLLVDGTLLGDVTGGMLNTLVIGGYTPVQSDGTLSAGAAPVASASGVTLDGVVNLTTLATNLDLLSNGSVTEPGGPLTVANVFGGAAGNFSLTNSANAIGQSLGITASGGDVVLVDGVNLALVGAHTGNNLFFEVAAQGGTLSVGTGNGPSDPPARLTAASGGRVTLVADHLTETTDSSVTAPGGTLELAPFSPLHVSLFGTSAAGQLLIDPTMLAIVTPGLATLEVGGYTNEPAGATTATPSASSLSVDGTVTLAPFAMGLNLQATGAITQAAPLLNVGTLAATGGSVTLANAGNLIANGAGMTATAGNVVLVDGESLTLNGGYIGKNLFIEVAAKGGNLTIGGATPATLTAASGARISLVADGLSANTAGSIGNAGGTVELAPFSLINVSLAGTNSTGQMLISASLLSDIDVGGGTLLVGGFTNLPAGSSGIMTTAGSITLDGAVNLSGTGYLSGQAGTLQLLANGAVTEPGGPLTVGTVTGVAAGLGSVNPTGVASGDFSLKDGGNQFQASTGITANNGNVVLVDQPALRLTGTFSGNNLYFQVFPVSGGFSDSAPPGGSLAIGATTAPAVLTAGGGGRISLVADTITATAASTIAAPNGTLEVAPVTAINESVAGTIASGQLLVGPTLLGDIDGGNSALNLLVLGGYTRISENGGVSIASSPSASATGITLDGPVNLTGRATNLELLANGPVTEPGGPLTVPIVLGNSVGDFLLTNPANAITQTGEVIAAGGNIELVDSVSLAVIGQHTGSNLFFEVATSGGTLALGGSLVSTISDGEFTSQPGLLLAGLPGPGYAGHVTLVADHITESGAGSITAAGGTLELAPFAAINTSLFGSATPSQLLIDPTLLSFITPGLSTLRVGGFTNLPSGATTAAPSAASISIDGTVNLGSIANTLDLQAIGPVTQSGANPQCRHADRRHRRDNAIQQRQFGGRD